MDKDYIRKFGLGTAQFGLDYGIADRIGKVAKEEVFKILQYAHRVGIDMLDTAYAYGESEDIIGEFISKSGKSFNIISKIPDLEKYDTSSVEKFCLETLKNLGQTKIYGYLVHKFDNLISYKKGCLREELETLKRKGLVDKVGISLYKTVELDYLLNNNISFDIVQVPYNIFDRRYNEYFSVLKEKNIEIHARSVFLQGLFFLEMDKINEKFYVARDMLERLRSISIWIPWNT